MALTTFDKDMNIIAALDDEPNDVGGLSAAELKAKFDEGGAAIKTFLNNTLIREVESTYATSNELNGVILGQIPDGSLTADKFSPGEIISLSVQATYNGGDK